MFYSTVLIARQMLQTAFVLTKNVWLKTIYFVEYLRSCLHPVDEEHHSTALRIQRVCRSEALIFFYDIK